MAESRAWFALTIREAVDEPATSENSTRDTKGGAVEGAVHGTPLPDQLAVILDDYAPIAIEDLQPLPLPPGGIWDPADPPPSDPPPAPLAWRVFFSTAEDRSGAADAVRATFPSLTLRGEEVADEDWAARSQRALTAITAGLIIVAPPWDRPATIPPGHTLVVIEPSRGFGTGHHQSTRLCLRALSACDVRGQRVLDIGTGSGVLAMAAAQRGAAAVLGVDVDPDAIAAARGSQALNPGAAAVVWLTTDFRSVPLPQDLAGPWDVVLANLTGGMLRTSAPRLRQLIGPSGRLIASGFDASERDEVLDALQLEPEKMLTEDSWLGLIARQ